MVDKQAGNKYKRNNKKRLAKKATGRKLFPYMKELPLKNFKYSVAIVNLNGIRDIVCMGIVGIEV